MIQLTKRRQHSHSHSNSFKPSSADTISTYHVHGFTLDTNQYFAKPSPVEVGDYIEFLAEIDLLVSASTCPQGDVSVACGDRGGVPVCHPLTVEIYKPREGWLEGRGWSSSEVSGYGGDHGLRCSVAVDVDADAVPSP